MENKCKWLIEKRLFEYEDKLINVLKNQNITYSFLDFDDKYRTINSYPFDYDDCVLFHGSINLSKEIEKTPYIPGVSGYRENYLCSNYYSSLSNFLLNNDYIFLPFNDLINNKLKIKNIFNSNKIFIRPNSYLKSFTGQVLDIYNEDELEIFMNTYKISLTDIIVVSSSKEITNEWRMVCADDEIISASKYSFDGEKKYVSIKDNKKIYDLASEINTNYISYPYVKDFIYIMDICQTSNGDYHLLEFNPFTSSNLYDNDLDIVVKYASICALKEWKMYYE